MPGVVPSFPNLEDATLLRGLRALASGQIDRFTHDHVVETPLGRSQRTWEISRLRVAAASHFVAIPEGVENASTLAVAVGEALRKAAGKPGWRGDSVVPVSADEERRVGIAPVRLGRRTHLLAFPDLAKGTDTPAPELLLFVQEEERHRIAIELHDSTSQHLVAIGLGLARLRRLVRATRAERRELQGLSRTLQAALREIRTLSYLMNPPQLERDGLQATVLRFLAGFETRTGVGASATVAGVPDASSTAVQHALFRVLQEVLSDIYRRGAAAQVDVELAAQAGWITLTVTSDGHGRAAADELTRAPVGVGVAGMRAPIGQLGGSLEVFHRARGNQVIARVPVGVSKREPASRRSSAKR